MRLRFLLFFCRFLPQVLSAKLLDNYWEKFWQQEEEEERLRAPDPPDKRIRGSERAVLAEAIVGSYPIHSLLEVGCGYGQNFHVFAKSFFDAKLVGVDIDQEAVEEGQRFLAASGIPHVELKHGDVSDLDSIEDDSFELVVCCGFLLEIGPERIEQVFSEMLRVCSGKILMMEQHQYGDTEKCIREQGKTYWVRDYQRLGEKFEQVSSVTVTKVPNPRWTLERWGEFASLVEVILL